MLAGDGGGGQSEWVEGRGEGEGGEWRPQVRRRAAQPGEAAAAPTADLFLARPVDAALAEPVGLVEGVVEHGVARFVH